MKSRSAALSVVALLPEPLAANATLIDPIPFASFADCPFARALLDYFEGLEDHLPASGSLRGEWRHGVLAHGARTMWMMA